MTFLFFALAFVLPPAHAGLEEKADPERFQKFEAYQERLESRFRQYKKLRGDDLKKAGWKEVARCDDGHSWSYVLEKKNDLLKCEGLNTFAGPEEHPCVPFTGALEKFKTFAAQKTARDCWAAAGQ